MGAFIPGVPVQPIAVRYPGHDRIDAVTWTYKQSHTYLYSLWCLLANTVNHLEVEFLPVYHPNEEVLKFADLLYLDNGIVVFLWVCLSGRIMAIVCVVHFLGLPGV